MKKLIGILALVMILCLAIAIPGLAVKIAPYSQPLHDIMHWDARSAKLIIMNPEGESQTVSWPSTVDLWNYDGTTWKFDLPDGDYFAFGKAFNETLEVVMTDADGGANEILITSTFTKVGAIAHKSIQVDLTFTPASIGTACPVGIASKVNLNGNLTRANNYPGYGWGVQGQIHVVTGTTIAGTTDYDPGPVYAGLRGVTTDAGTSTYTDGTITSLYAETQISQNAASGSFRVFLAWLRCQGSGTSTDIDAALYIDSGNAWGNNIIVGIDINDSVTGIDIGACTTGINVDANTVIPQLITIGTSTNPIHWSGAASNILVYQENIDITPGSVTANKFFLSAAQSAATTSGRLECFRAVVASYSTTDVTADLRALVGQVEFSGDMNYIGGSSYDFSGAYGVIASIWSGSDVTADGGNLGKMYPLGIFFGLETGTSLSGEDAYIYIYNYGKVCPNSVMKLYNASTPAEPTYLFDKAHSTLGSASGPFYPQDVNPHSAPADASLGADGHIKILIGATPYYIPFFANLE